MPEPIQMRPIAHIRSAFPTKFGIPRQSGLARALTAQVVFEPPYREAAALRGLEEFSHIWLIWQFSAAAREGWSHTVRPPRLGGNQRMGVFATRSPFRPNAIGLSAVKLERVELSTPAGPLLHVAGADLMDGTPILDIKPYLPYADSIPDAAGGFASGGAPARLEVACPPELLARVPEGLRAGLLEVLACDPRPPYQHDPDRRYGMAFGGVEVSFTVAGGTLTVRDIAAGGKTEDRTGGEDT